MSLEVSQLAPANGDHGNTSLEHKLTIFLLVFIERFALNGAQPPRLQSPSQKVVKCDCDFEMNRWNVLLLDMVEFCDFSSQDM